MKTLIVYSTWHGCAEKCSVKLQQHLDGEVEVFDINKIKSVALDDYQRIIIGGSIHMGKIQKEISKFCNDQRDLLKTKKIGLFICCMEQTEKAQQEFQTAFPRDLIDHATATGILGGEFNFEKMNFIQRAMIKKIAKIDHSVSNIDEQSIIKFAENLL